MKLLMMHCNSFFPFRLHCGAFTVVCVSHCPKNSNFEKFICRYEDQDDADDDPADGYELVADKQCMYQIKTRQFINRCWPDTDLSAALNDAQDAAEFYNVTTKIKYEYEVPTVGTSWFTRFLADVITLRGFIFGFGIGIATFLSFIYLYILRIPFLMFTIVWGGILSLGVLLFVGSWLLWSLANRWDDDGIHSDTEVAAMRGFAYTGIVLTVLYVCLVIVMRKRVMLALGVIKQAARALASIPSIIFLPVMQTIGIMLFLLPWMFYVLYLASSGETEVHSRTVEREDDDYTYNYRTFEYDQNTRYAFLYLLFCWFWTSEFIVAVGQIVTALCFARWYFTRNKSKVHAGTLYWVRTQVHLQESTPPLYLRI